MGMDNFKKLKLSVQQKKPESKHANAHTATKKPKWKRSVLSKRIRRSGKTLHQHDLRNFQNG